MLAQDHPILSALVEKLLDVREVAAAKVAVLGKEMRRFVRDDPTLRRFLTVPGVGPVTALAFRATVDEPSRFRTGPRCRAIPRADTSTISVRGNRSAGPHLEMRRSVYSNVPVRGRQCPSHEGAALVPAQSLGARLAKRIGSKKARVAIARKIAVILHCIWTDGTEFWWTKERAAA